MSNLDKILAKANARLAKLAEKEIAIREGKTLPRRTSLGTTLKSLRATERKEIKTREDFVKDCLQRRDIILDTTIPWTRIQAMLPIAKRALSEMREYLAPEVDKVGETLRAKYSVHQLKIMAGDSDLSNIYAALNNLDDFNDALRSLIISLLQSPREITPEEVKVLWDNNLGDKDVAVLTRGTTLFFSIDHFAEKFYRNIDSANNAEDVSSAWRNFRDSITTLFNTYKVEFDVDAFFTHVGI